MHSSLPRQLLFPERNAEQLQIAREPGMPVVFPTGVEHIIQPHRRLEGRILIAIKIKLMDFNGQGGLSAYLPH